MNTDAHEVLMRRETDEMNLTAYALGELEGSERAAIEARLESSAEDRRFVEEVRGAVRVVSDELSREQTSGLDAIHYAAIELRLRESAGPRPTDRRAVVRARIGFGLSLAASILIIFGTAGAILFLMSRHAELAVNLPQKQPSSGPVLIPLDPSSPDPDRPASAAARTPRSSEPFVNVADQPVSSFALDPDTASYDELRRALFDDRLPAHGSVKIEGLINAFAYDGPMPAGGAAFAGRIEVGECPWQPNHRLARIAVKAREGSGVIAEDVRTEVAFVPAAVRSYRLLGYQGGVNDDASGPAPSGPGERVLAGKLVTALYELVPPMGGATSTQLLTLRVRYRPRREAEQQTIQFAGTNAHSDLKAESSDFRFVAAVAELGLLLDDSPARGHASMNDVIALAEAGRGADPSGQRRQFIELARHAKELLG